MDNDENDDIWKPADLLSDQNKQIDRMYGYTSSDEEETEEDTDQNKTIQPEQLENVTSAPKEKSKKGKNNAHMIHYYNINCFLP